MSFVHLQAKAKGFLPIRIHMRPDKTDKYLNTFESAEDDREVVAKENRQRLKCLILRFNKRVDIEGGAGGGEGIGMMAREEAQADETTRRRKQ